MSPAFIRINMVLVFTRSNGLYDSSIRVFCKQLQCNSDMVCNKGCHVKMGAQLSTQSYFMAYKIPLYFN